MIRPSMSRRRLLGLAAGLGLGTAALGLMTGCARGGAEAEVVVSFNDLSQPFFVAMRRELEDEAAKLGVKVQVLDAQNNSSKQISDLQAAAVQGAKVVIVAPTDSKALAGAADDLVEQGVAVISVDRNIAGGKTAVPHVGADNVAAWPGDGRLGREDLSGRRARRGHHQRPGQLQLDRAREGRP